MTSELNKLLLNEANNFIKNSGESICSDIKSQLYNSMCDILNDHIDEYFKKQNRIFDTEEEQEMFYNIIFEKLIFDVSFIEK